MIQQRCSNHEQKQTTTFSIWICVISIMPSVVHNGTERVPQRWASPGHLAEGQSSQVFSPKPTEKFQSCVPLQMHSFGLQSYEMQAQTGQSSDFSISQYSRTWGSDAANIVLLEPEWHTKRNICVYQKMYRLLNVTIRQQKFKIHLLEHQIWSRESNDRQLQQP